MSIYLVAVGNIADGAQFQTYARAAGPVGQRYGATLIASGSARRLEGKMSEGQHAVVLEFPDEAALDRFWASEDYARVRPLRDGLSFNIFTAPGL